MSRLQELEQGRTDDRSVRSVRLEEGPIQDVLLIRPSIRATHFGLGGVGANGRNALASVVHRMLTLRPTAFLAFNGLFAHAWGQGIIDQVYAERDANYGFIEAMVAF